MNDRPLTKNVDLPFIESGIDSLQNNKLPELSYHALFEQVTDPILVTDFHGNFKDVNSSFSNLFGYTKTQLLEMNVKSLLEEEHIKSHPIRFDLLAVGENVFNERKMVHKNGSLVYVEANAKKLNYDTILVITRDISDRKKAGETLHKSEASLRTIFDNTDTIYVLVDNEFRIISYNPRAVDFAARELGQPMKIGSFFLDYLSHDKRQVLEKRMKTVLEGNPIFHEVNYPQPDGDSNWYHVRIFPISSADGAMYGIMIAVSDITIKKLLEQELLEHKIEEQKKITRAVLKAQEIERNKIGQELHDNVNQILSCVKLQLDMLEPAQQLSRDILQRSKSSVETAIREIRLLTREHATPPKKINLRDWVENLCLELNENTRVSTYFECVVSSKLLIEENLKLNIYRIVQEQINNILKYASAEKAEISIDSKDGAVYISIADNGKGFQQPRNRKGIGISNMINRVESYNGQIDIQSSPGNGCQISIRIPF